MNNICWGNSLRPRDDIYICRYISGLTFAHVMACCLTAPGHYMEPCWLIIRASDGSNFTRSAHELSPEHVFRDYTFKLLPYLPRANGFYHDDVIKWKHFPRNWPFVREIHRSPVNFPHKGQWRGTLMFSLIYAWINDWVNNREAGDLRRQHGHYDVIVM